MALDRYFGFSSGWMRFMGSELRIVRLRHDFTYDWEALRATASSPPSDDDLAKLLSRARSFLLAVDGVIADETNTWAAEFTSTLDQAEQKLAADQRL